MIGGGGVGVLQGCFLGDDEKKLSMPPLGLGTGVGACTRGAGGGTRAFDWAAMCASRRTLRVRVNSSLLCSILSRD